MEPKLRYTAVEKGDINLIDAYSTDAELKQYDMVVLKMMITCFPTLSRCSNVKSF